LKRRIIKNAINIFEEINMFKKMIIKIHEEIIIMKLYQNTWIYYIVPEGKNWEELRRIGKNWEELGRIEKNWEDYWYV